MERNKIYGLSLICVFTLLMNILHAFAASPEASVCRQSRDWKPTAYYLAEFTEPVCRVKLHVELWDEEGIIPAKEAVLSADACGRQMQVTTDELGTVMILVSQGSELTLGKLGYEPCSVMLPEKSDHCDSVCLRQTLLDTLEREQLVSVSICEYEEDPPVQVVDEQSVDMPDSIVYMIVEQMPSFDGGDQGAFTRWAAGEVKYPADVCVQGYVVVGFVVEPDGSVSNIEILRSPEEWLSVEARRVVEASSGRWNPGLQRGKKVRVRYAQPIRWEIPVESDPDSRVEKPAGDHNR